MTKYWDPPLFFTQNYFYQNDSALSQMDFRHNFKQCNIFSAGPTLYGNICYTFFFKEGFPDKERIN